LCSLYVYLRYSGVISRAPGMVSQMSLPDDPQRLYWLAVVLFLCAVLSKTFFGTMPLVALLLIAWKRGRWTLNDLKGALPLIGVSIGLWVLTIYMERHRAGIILHESWWQFAQSSAGQLTARVILAGKALWFYL